MDAAGARNASQSDRKKRGTKAREKSRIQRRNHMPGGAGDSKRRRRRVDLQHGAEAPGANADREPGGGASSATPKRPGAKSLEVLMAKRSGGRCGGVADAAGERGAA